MQINTKKVQAAVILCGGNGSRLGVIGRYSPKCLLRVGSDPILFHHLDLYEKLGVTDVYFALGHLGSKVRNAVTARRSRLNYHFLNANSVGTGGAIIRALSHFAQKHYYYWVSMGDIVCRPNLISMWKRAHRDNVNAMILGVRVIDPSNYGVLVCDKDGWLLDFKEKEVSQGPALVDAGFYLFSCDFLTGFEGRKQISLEYEVFPIAQNVAVAEHDGLWYDIATISRLREARLSIANSFG